MNHKLQLFAIIILLLPVLIVPQTYSVAGTATYQGSAVENVSIILSDGTNFYQTSTGADGNFEIDLPQGLTYSLEAENVLSDGKRLIGSVSGIVLETNYHLGAISLERGGKR